MRELRRACAPATASLRDVAEVIDEMASSMCMLTDADSRLVGLVTDGDLRRALLNGAGLEDAALPYATTTPQTVDEGSPRALVLDLMRALRISAVPELDANRRVVGLHTLSDVVGAQSLPNVAVIMAGGMGTRLGDITRHTPKPLVRVAGRSIIEWIVLNLVGDGIRDIFVSVNHLADQVEEHLGDGTRLGCNIRYLRESRAKPLGTAGSLTLLLDECPGLTDSILVMNGDLMVQFDADQLLEHHHRSGAGITMAVRSYQHEVPFGVVESDGRVVNAVTEKPTISLQINAAVYAVQPRLLGLLPLGEPSSMPELVQRCLDRDEKVLSWQITSDWIDVGTPMDLARAKGLV